MTEEMVTFQMLHNRQIAEEMGSLLERQGIPYQITENKKYFDPSFAFNRVDPEINLKLKNDDFIRAREVLESVYSDQLKDVDNGYYLFKFSDAELMDIIRKPDEWGIFDHALAKKILFDRGIVVTDDVVSEVMSSRVKELRKPDELPVFWVAIGYIAALMGGFFGIMMGWLFSTMTKTLPNGERVYLYNEAGRQHGRRIFALGLIIFSFFMIKVLVIPLL